MFAMAKQQHQYQINQMKESSKQALEMAQQSIKNGEADDRDVQ